MISAGCCAKSDSKLTVVSSGDIRFQYLPGATLFSSRESRALEIDRETIEVGPTSFSKGSYDHAIRWKTTNGTYYGYIGSTAATAIGPCEVTESSGGGPGDSAKLDVQPVVKQLEFAIDSALVDIAIQTIPGLSIVGQADYLYSLHCKTGVERCLVLE